jgi:hypothetical protein
MVTTSKVTKPILTTPKVTKPILQSFWQSVLDNMAIGGVNNSIFTVSTFILLGLITLIPLNIFHNLFILLLILNLLSLFFCIMLASKGIIFTDTDGTNESKQQQQNDKNIFNKNVKKYFWQNLFAMYSPVLIVSLIILVLLLVPNIYKLIDSNILISLLILIFPYYLVTTILSGFTLLNLNIPILFN